MKQIRFLSVALILLFLVSLVGCYETENATTEPIASSSVESGNLVTATEDHRTGPVSEYCRVFSTNSDFAEWISAFNTQGKVYLSFDFDSYSSIGEATYIFETITDMGSEQLYDYQTSFGYSFRYTFCTHYYPPELGIDQPTFSINCVYPCLDDDCSVKAINEENISFQRVSAEENTYAYTVVSGDVELMELTIKVDMEGQMTVEDVLQLLQDNMIFIS